MDFLLVVGALLFEVYHKFPVVLIGPYSCPCFMLSLTFCSMAIPFRFLTICISLSCCRSDVSSCLSLPLVYDHRGH
jgi:hypothetical protein